MICSIILLFLIIKTYENDKLAAYIKSSICWTAYMYLLTEILSVLRILNQISVAIGWGFFIIILLIVYLRIGKQIVIADEIKGIKSFLFKEPILVFIGAVALLLAVVTIPYNWDSMTYHLARLNYWKQYQSVAHYSTNIIRQITSPVLSEFVNLNIYVLMKGNDIFLQLLQCVSFLTNTAILYGIAAKLGCRKRLCFLAGFLFMTMPIAFGEALTTQVDHFAALWTFAVVYILLDYVDINKKFEFNKKTVLDTIFMSASIAFAYLAKPSVMFAILLFAIWLLIVCIQRKESVSVILKLLICSVCIMGIILAPEVGRNLYTFHAISDPIAGARQLIGRKNPRYVFINFLKNFIWNFPNIYWKDCTEQLTNFAYKMAEILKVEINAPSISEDGKIFAMRVAQDYGHDTAINPIIIFTLICSLMLQLFNRKEQKDNKITRSYLAVSIASFLLFCAVLRWEPYVTRYMIAYLGLLCPAAAIMIQDFGEKIERKKFYYALIGIIFFTSAVEMASMVEYHVEKAEYDKADDSRISGYFYWQPGSMYSAHLEMQSIVKEQGYKNIGLITLEDSYDYPVFEMLEPYVDRIEHINVDNVTNVYEDMEFLPDCIIVLEDSDVEEIYCHGTCYAQVLQIDEYVAVVTQ